MKKLACILLAALMLGLCACAQSGDEGTTGAAPANDAQTQTTGAAAQQDPKALAESCIGKSVQELYALIGQPGSSEYAPSCLNPEAGGEDGMLYYDGFVVYTYKEGDTETVEYVE